ncbi:PIN domain-containing protein [Promethearchaeum syntrophicum]|uniref:PIN domain-containing protein n=1 Tax=Promethearchaeum syntrophicum TaxID=2594042 RepID=A0A5B9DCN6_9ARCH|nr:PIN domain-containing protein [Candidatus Prometheoarchaeum syntrophicum]QEE16523.1 PIN domain protein [Candidatus Prometheoarchaeum syntrophicum]
MNYKYVLDSFAWVEYAIGSNMGEFVEFLLNNADCFTPTIVIAELSDKFHRENQLKDWMLLYKFIKNATQTIPLSDNLAFQSGQQKTKLRENQHTGEKKIGLADAIIYQTSLNQEAKLVSGDDHFRNIKNVLYLKNMAKIKQEMKKIKEFKLRNNH